MSISKQPCNNSAIYNFCKIFITNTSSFVLLYKVSYYSTYYTLCVPIRLRLCMYAYKKACTCILANFQSTIIVCACVDTQIHLHTHIHALTCRKTQAFNLPFVTRTYIHTRTHTLKLFGEGRSDGKATYDVLGQAWQ